MRRLVGSVILVVVAFVTVPAQDAATVKQRAEALRAQLRDVTDKQAQLQAREQQLDEDLKPENIERRLAGVGTTDATALRDRRRQQLEREKAAVEEQLQSLATSRSQLEASIASAEAEAVRLRAAAQNTNTAPRQTAAGGPAPPAASKKPGTRPSGRRRHRKARRRAQ
jgi:membrane protein involved in colicin uptake